MSARMRTIVIVAVAVSALAGGIYLGVERQAAAKQSIAALYGSSLPDQAMHSQPFSQWRSKTLFINFWATWCEPCREEIPALIRLQGASSSKNLQIVGIALDSPERVAEFAKSYSINYPLLIGGMGAMEMMRAHGNGIGALPFTLVV